MFSVSSVVIASLLLCVQQTHTVTLLYTSQSTAAVKSEANIREQSGGIHDDEAALITEGCDKGVIGERGSSVQFHHQCAEANLSK